MMRTANINAVVLAAGRSTRFDGAKLSQDLGGRPLLQHSLAAAQATFPGRVILVVGHSSGSVTELSDGLADVVVVNPDYSSGQGSSLAVGVGACRNDADAIVIMLADQPLVTTDALNQIIGAWTGDKDHIVVSDYGGSQGPPVLFSKGAFDHLCGLTGDSGAKKVIQSGQFDVASVAIGPLGLDVDTPQDLETAAQLLSAEK
jgi:molybdenum cofactor cytidylyltransferase